MTGLPAPAIEISAGREVTCAITNANDLYCWGLNSVGQMGDTTTVDRWTATYAGSYVAHVYVGSLHVCAMQTHGELLCWGGNSRGQVGDGTFVDKHSSTRPTSPAFAQQLAVGLETTFVRPAADELDCWGSGDGLIYGPSSTDHNQAMAIPSLSGIADVALGNYHQCVVIAGGGMKCWGSNAFGQLGDGTKTDNAIPVFVSGITGRPDQISMGGNYSCARLGAFVRCWGFNDSGQLGDGTNTSRTVPTAVSW